MTDRSDRDRGDMRYEQETSGGASFVMGLLAGTVLGAGLGMLFAPRAGSELRSHISDQAGQLATDAQQGYRRAADTATDWADRAKTAVSRGAEEATRYAREGQEQASDAASIPSPGVRGRS